MLVNITWCPLLLRAQQELSELESQMDSHDTSKVQDTASHLSKVESQSLNLEEVAEEAEMGEEGLLKLQEEVDQLQEDFDRAVIEKHNLALTCQQLSEKLKSANHLLERLVLIVN